MLDDLAKIFDDGGRLLGVNAAILESEWVTAIELRFESLSAVFRAVSDDDSLNLSIASLSPEPGEVIVDLGSSPPWMNCVGSGLQWVWQLINQQGYHDGVRFEFGEGTIIELVVVASAIKVFMSINKDSIANTLS